MNNRQKSDKIVKKISKQLSGRMTNNSGAVSDDGDIRIEGYLIEHKFREGSGSFKMPMKIWEKIRKQALERNRKPLYIFSNSKYDVACTESCYIGRAHIDNVVLGPFLSKSDKGITMSMSELLDKDILFTYIGKVEFSVMMLSTFKEIENGAEKDSGNT